MVAAQMLWVRSPGQILVTGNVWGKSWNKVFLLNLVRKLWRTDKSNKFLRVMPPVQLLPQKIACHKCHLCFATSCKLPLKSPSKLCECDNSRCWWHGPWGPGWDRKWVTPGPNKSPGDGISSCPRPVFTTALISHQPALNNTISESRRKDACSHS